MKKMEIWQNLKKKRNTGYDSTPLPHSNAHFTHDRFLALHPSLPTVDQLIKSIIIIRPYFMWKKKIDKSNGFIQIKFAKHQIYIQF